MSKKNMNARKNVKKNFSEGKSEEQSVRSGGDNRSWS